MFVSEKSFYNSVRSWRVTNPTRSKGHLPREQHFLLLAAVVEKKTPFQVSLPLSLCLRTHTQQTGLRSLTPKRTLHSLYFSLSLSRFLPNTHFHVLSLSLFYTLTHTNYYYSYYYFYCDVDVEGENLKSIDFSLTREGGIR